MKARNLSNRFEAISMHKVHPMEEFPLDMAWQGIDVLDRLLCKCDMGLLQMIPPKPL